MITPRVSQTSLFVANLVSHNSFFLYRPKTQNTRVGLLEYINPLLYFQFFTIWVSATKQASHTLKFSTAWASATKQASHTHKIFTLRRKKDTKRLAPISCAHAEAEEGYQEACSYLLCQLWGGRRIPRTKQKYHPGRQQSHPGGIQLTLNSHQ